MDSGLSGHVKKMKEIQKAHYDSTTPMDSYFTGMWNGMEVLIAGIEQREGNFKAVEQLSLPGIEPKNEAGEVGRG